MSGLPVRGAFHHAAVVVSDLAASVDFYQRCFGGEVEYVKGVGGAEMAALHGLPSADFDLAFLDFGNARIELFQFHDPHPPATALPPAANHVGAAHVAFEVDDVEESYAALVAAGVEFSRPPLAPTDGPAAGFCLAFCFDPDGNRIEIIAPPEEEAATPRPAKLVTLSVTAEGRERFLELAEAVLNATAAEPGAETYTLSESSEDPLTFVIYERYVDAAAVEAHHHQPELGDLLGSLKPLLSAPPQIVELTTIAAARA